MINYALAIDIGATSGRHIVGWREDGCIRTEEVYRFPNGGTEQDGHLIWNIDSMLANVKKGIDAALEKYPEIRSLSVDTWGVDYVLLKGDKEMLPCYAYRDSRTEEPIKKVHEIIPFSDFYRRTGCQFQPFTTIYQFYSDLMTGRLQEADDYLMMPEYFCYKLCGVKAHEYTNGTTTGLVSAETGEIDMELVKMLGFPEKLFTKFTKPGTILGKYKGIDVMLVATHDTGSAVEGIPMVGNQTYISSGTWSLLGVKTEKPITDEASEKVNYANEGGVGYNRYQKNIMGMWLITNLQKECLVGVPITEVVKQAEESTYTGYFDANDPTLLAPKSMKTAIYELLKKAHEESGMPLPETDGDYYRAAYASLARGYKESLDEMEANTGKVYDDLYIVGGGAKNGFLNKLTEEYTGKHVIALPIEATAIGNIKVQLEAYDKQ